jgi:hypothetical protein
MRRAALLLLVAACARTAAPPAPAPLTPALPGDPTWRLGPAIAFSGACDASGALSLPGGRLLVVDDEDSELLLYAETGGAPLARLDLVPFLDLPKAKQEADLEAAAVWQGRIVLMGSHGRTRTAKAAPARQRLVPLGLTDGGGAEVQLASAGTTFGGLIPLLLAAPELAPFDLATAETRSPKTEGGLNIEGISELPDGRLLLGLRSPLAPDGRAIMVPLGGVAEMFQGGQPTIGSPILLDLGGRGIRELARVGDTVYLAAGDTFAHVVPSALYRWREGEGATPLAVDVGRLNIEGLVPLADGALLVITDEGSRLVDGVACKKLEDRGARGFAAHRLEPPR